MARHLTAAPRLPLSYRAGNTLPHRFPAGLKLLGLFALSAGAFSSAPGLLIAALLTAAVSLAARINPLELLRGSRSLAALSLCVLVFKTVDPGAPGVVLGAITVRGLRVPSITVPYINPKGFFEGIVSGLRVMVSFAAGSLLFAVTTMRELRLSLGRAERVIRGLFASGRRVTVPRLSLGISLMLGFIPRFFEIWETANLACEARSGRRGLRRLSLLVPLVTGRMMEVAANTAETLEARGLEF